MSESAKKILLVEDEPIAQTLYQNRLQREGFEISLAEDGEVALKELSKMQPDLVILDLMLPKVNGTEVLKQIRSDERLKNIPVLVISNAFMTELSKKALESGATQGMMKTECTPGRLVEAVRDLLGFKSAFDLTDSPASDNKQIEEFADAAERALADEMTLKQTREDFIEKAPTEVAKIREHSLAYIKAGATPGAQKPLNNLYEEVRFFATRAGLSGCPRTAHLANAFEALLFEIVYKPGKVTASMLQSVAQAVDCLEKMCQKADAGAVETNLHGKILVVDDDAVCNLAMVTALKRANFDAVGFEQPVEALQMAQSDQFDIIYLDINMPGMSGFEVCEKLRTMPEYKEAPIIFVTSFTDFEHRKRGILSGGNDFIPKPISPVELTLKTTMRLLQPQGQWAETSAVATCLKTTLRLLQEEEAQAATAQAAGPKPAAQTSAPSKDSSENAPIPFTAPKPVVQEMPPVAPVTPSPVAADVPPPAIEKLQMVKPEEPAKASSAEELPDVNAVNMANKSKPVQPTPEPPKAEAPVNVEPPAIEKIEMAKPEEPAKPAEPAQEKLPDVNDINIANKNQAPAPVEAPVENIEPPKPVKEEAKDEKLPHVNGVNGTNGANGTGKHIPAEIKIESKSETTPPIEAPRPVEPVVPAPSPRQITPQTDSPTNRNTTPIMENTIETKKPTIDDAARGIARILFGDENITDMNVRLTRIALESYNVHGTKDVGEVARHVTKIIFGDQNVTDMNVRLTRIALERYNITEVLGISNGSNGNGNGRMNLTAV